MTSGFSQNVARPLVLSLFPGIDLLGRGFTEAGFCVVRGPDILTGDDNRTFFPPKDRFDGVIGGPPCQDFSLLNRSPGQYSHEMTQDYIRVVSAASPSFFLYENVATAPPIVIAGYKTQRFSLDLAWFSPFTRLRYFVFGSRDGRLLDPMVGEKSETIAGGCVTCADERGFRAMCEIQGLPDDYDLPSFTLSGKKRAVGNGVPLPMARYVAGLILSDYYGRDAVEFAEIDRVGKAVTDHRRCACGCGRIVVGRAKTASTACRKRLSRAAQRA